ncbi:TFIIB-type zinc ribbon-containing protein [Protaetiibacter intestinalis]|uniref:TFIIB-type zinc ribbon-containing protein n=1 Tax=Protaetiibacter intestinalis TaxID=2419774 RepID=A0A387B7A8_9MICO|nr:TFIIB-type zinc ribbon-containing protein [Protaetiibacter intestinalis]AYF98233.1 TFIIB-type zinc ribbon-containing protein [Protaetiibacter intestinalis]
MSIPDVPQQPGVPPVPPAASAPVPPPAAPAAPVPPVAPAEPAPVQTGNERRDGLDRCPKCGSTDIGPIVGTNKLRCAFCRFEWEPGNFNAAVGFDSPVGELHGTVVTTGAGDIAADVSNIVTLKCQGCGAEVVINTERQLQARCHWCRQVLSMNTQIPNGAVPDALLPFTVTHEQAVEHIRHFAGRRRTFALKKFKQEFTPENVVGVYMPYLLIDGNLHADIAGHGEIKTRQYTRGTDQNRKTYYDADVYQITRSFDYTVDDLTIESSSARANQDVRTNTNNVINTILPFDTKAAVGYDARYMGEFTSEKRDLNVDAVMPVARSQMLSIARQKATDSAPRYDRGIRWESEALDVKGTRWVSVLLPVWLYSYYEKKSNGSEFLHYIAVNGRTGETMGSIPVSVPKLLLVSLTIGTVLEGVALWIVATF